MSPRYKRIVTPLFVLLLLWTARGCVAPLWYSSPDLEARVVDDDTELPVEGVIAVAHWQLRTSLFHGRTTGQLVVLETVTNADGQFSFPAWGPKLRPLSGALELSSSPTLVLFKSGYTLAYPSPQINPTMDLAPRVLPLPPWHHTTIRMKKFAESPKKYDQHLGFLSVGLESMFRSDTCSWKQVPRLLVALDGEEKRLQGLGIPNNLSPITTLKGRTASDQAQCGSVEEHLRSYLP